jgi:hypothetical protein
MMATIESGTIAVLAEKPSVASGVDAAWSQHLLS